MTPNLSPKARDSTYQVGGMTRMDAGDSGAIEWKRTDEMIARGMLAWSHSAVFSVAVIWRAMYDATQGECHE